MVHRLIKIRGGNGTSWRTASRNNRKKIAANNNSLWLQNDDDDGDSLRKIASLAKKGKFDLLFQELSEMSSDRFLERISRVHGGEPSSSSSSSLLHVVLAYRPPLHIVELILNRMKECGDSSDMEPRTYTAYPVPEEIKDASTGQTPLHLAVAAGCDISIIDRLLSGVSLLVPALTKDLLDRYPLHWACCCRESHSSSTTKKRSSSSSSSSQRAAERENRRETVYLLLNTYPVAVVIADVYGKTPLDYALENKLDARILDALQTVAQHHQKYKAVRKLVVSPAANRGALPPPLETAKQQPKRTTVLKRRKLLLRSKCAAAAAAAAVVIGTQPPTSEMATERDSTDNEDPGHRSSSNEEEEEEDGDDDKVSCLLGALLTKNSSSTLSERRNTLRLLDSNSNNMDDLSTLGWDVLSATAPSSSSPTKKKKRLPSSTFASPIVRVKTLAISPPPAAPCAVHQHVAAAAAVAATSGIITSHVRCRCKSLLRGRLKQNKPNSKGGGGSRRRVSIIKTTTSSRSPPKGTSRSPPSMKPATPAQAEKETSLLAELEDQEEQDVEPHNKTAVVHAYHRFVRV